MYLNVKDVSILLVKQLSQSQLMNYNQLITQITRMGATERYIFMRDTIVTCITYKILVVVLMGDWEVYMPKRLEMNEELDYYTVIYIMYEIS